VLFLLALGLAVLASSPRILLLTLAYTYLASAFIGLAWHRFRRRPSKPGAEHPEPAGDTSLSPPTVSPRPGD
jgi:hypothetical protein